MAPNAGGKPAIKAIAKAVAKAQDNTDGWKEVLPKYPAKSSSKNKNITKYLSYYSDSFQDTKRTRENWEQHRRRLFKNNPYITVQVSNIKIKQFNDSIKVTFIQKFKSGPEN